MTEPEQLEGTEGESQITRRTFLQGGLAVAGSMAVAPSVLRSHSGFRLPMATPGKAQPTPTTLSSYKPFNPHVPAGPPTGLPKRIATNFPSGSAYFQQFADNVRLAVESRGYHFTSTTYGSDVAQNVNAINELVNSGIGAVILQVQDEQGQAPTVQKLIDQGIYVIYSVAGPCDTQVIADQYQCGYVQGINAAKWVTQHMGGQAQVCVFNASQISPFFIPRAQGRIDGVKKAGKGVQIVANEPIKLLTPEEGQQLAASVLQAHPGVNVWLGDDDTVIGVVAALQQAGKKGTDKIFVSGFNGQANALAAVKAGGLFREDVGFPNGVYEYACGALCCDWIEGKSVPQIIDLGIFVVTPQNVNAYTKDNNSPATAYKTAIGKYVTYYGNTSFQHPKYIPHAVTTGAH